MPTFLYKTIDGGAAATATIEATDRSSAVREIVRRGLTPTSIEQVGAVRTSVSGRETVGGVTGPEPSGERLGGSTRDGAEMSSGRVSGLFSSRVMSRSEVATFIRELATALSAGLPLVASLRTMMRQGRSAKQREMLIGVITQVEQGRSLADAMRDFESTFGELTVNLVRAGEMSGQLADVLMQAADLLDKDLKLRRSVTGALLYPLIICVLVVIAIIVVITFIVPNILKQLAGSAVSLPWPTRVVQGVGEFFSSWWFGVVPGWAACIVIAVVAFIMFRQYYATTAGRLAVDSRLLTMPLVGRLLRDVAVARFTRTLGTLTTAGIPILAALKVTKGTLGNRAMERVIDDVAEQVTAGKTIAEPMEKSGYFPPMLVQVVNLGERSGKLDQMLSNAAKAFEERTEQSVKLFTTALPPVLVVFMACIVGFVVMAILLALLSLQDGAMIR